LVTKDGHTATHILLNLPNTVPVFFTTNNAADACYSAKTVSSGRLGSTTILFVSSAAPHVGLTVVHWGIQRPGDSKDSRGRVNL